MNPHSEEPFLKEGKLAAAAASFWLLSAAGTIAALALALWLIKRCGPSFEVGMTRGLEEVR